MIIHHRLFVYGILTLACGIGALLWHGVQLLRSSPGSASGFRPFSRAENSWALLIAAVLILAGLLLLYCWRTFPPPGLPRP